MRRKFCYRSLQPTAAYHRRRKIYFLSVAAIPQCFRYGYVFESKGVKIVFANCDFKFKQASVPCRTAKFTSKIYLNFTFLIKLRIVKHWRQI